jgi:hypothetical protein
MNYNTCRRDFDHRRGAAVQYVSVMRQYSIDSVSKQPQRSISCLDRRLIRNIRAGACQRFSEGLQELEASPAGRQSYCNRASL